MELLSKTALYSYLLIYKYEKKQVYLTTYLLQHFI